jgi:type IV secretion system protein VirB9
MEGTKAMNKAAKLTALLMAGALMASSPAYAGKVPRDGSADARIKTVTYHENDVYRLKAHYGFTSVIEFSSKEQIISITLGDSAAWEVIKPSIPHLLFIKPLEENAATNMTVITSRRIYSFEMNAGKAASNRSSVLTFRLKFVYPGEQALQLAHIGSAAGANMNRGGGVLPGRAVSAWNFDYSYSGAKKLRPVRTFDDGEFTYFQFEKSGPAPAIFAVDEFGNESLVNFSNDGPVMAVHGVGRQFTLRDGDTVTCIFNEQYEGPAGIQKTTAPIMPMEEKSAPAQAKPEPATTKPQKLVQAPRPPRKPSAAALAREEENWRLFAWLKPGTDFELNE